MSSYHCYLCASDDGILLDISGPGGKVICGNIETCLSVKVDQSEAPSSKICHKCAYELATCGKFVQKYRQARDVALSKSNSGSKSSCSLCLEPARTGYIFDCGGGTPVNNWLHKIQELFDDSTFKNKRKNLSICLDCRYHLDVLYDLKCIYQTTSGKLRSLNEKSLQLADLPKTKTRVVIRKTTYVQTPRLNGAEVSDTDSSSTTSAMPLKPRRGRSRKDSVTARPSTFRICQQCEISVEDGIDMYKYHRSGLTICKDCWLAMDTETVTLNKRRKLGLAGVEVGTRRCSIILKDVMRNPAKYENFYKIEKDEHGNTTFIVTDDSSESEEREKLPVKRSRRIAGIVPSVETTTASRKGRPPKRTVDRKSTDHEDEPPEKIKSQGKRVDDEKPSTSTRLSKKLVISDTEVVVARTRRSTTAPPAESPKNAKAASDPELPKPQERKRGLKQKLENSSEPVESSSNETKPAAAPKARRAAKTAVSTVSTVEPTERPVRRTRKGSVTSQDDVSLSVRGSTTTRRVKSTSESGSPPAKTRKLKSKSVSPKDSGSELELEKPYSCGVCNVEYKNKLMGMKHELSHAKQPEVKLQRVTIPKIIVEEVPSMPILIEEPEEQSHDVSSTSGSRVDDAKNVEKVSTEKTSADVAETTDKKEHSEETESTAEANVTPADADITRVSNEEEEEKVKDKDTADKVEDKLKGEEDQVGEKDKDKAVSVEDKAEDKADSVEDKAEDKADSVEGKAEDKADSVEGKAEDKADSVEEKVEDKADSVEDKTVDSTDANHQNGDKVEEAENKVEDKSEDKVDSKKTNEDNADAEDKSQDAADAKNEGENEADAKNEDADEADAKNEAEDEADAKNEDEDNAEAKDKSEDKVDVTDENEDKTDVLEVTGSAAPAKDEERLENSVENAEEIKPSDASTISEPHKNEDNDEKEKSTRESVDSEKPGSPPSNNEVEKKIESTGLREKPSEEESRESSEASSNVNGVSVDNQSKVAENEANEAKDEAAVASNDAVSKERDVDAIEAKSVEPKSVEPVTSTDGKEETDDKHTEEKFVLRDNGTPKKNPEDAAEVAKTEVPDTREKSTTEKSDESSVAVARDVANEVFDLAAAEVKKRLEKKMPRDEECTTPLSETLENISQEISSSADMPSLEPLIDEQSSNNQS